MNSKYRKLSTFPFSSISFLYWNIKQRKKWKEIVNYIEALAYNCFKWAKMCKETIKLNRYIRIDSLSLSSLPLFHCIYSGRHNIVKYLHEFVMAITVCLVPVIFCDKKVENHFGSSIENNENWINLKNAIIQQSWPIKAKRRRLKKKKRELANEYNNKNNKNWAYSL